MSEHPTVLILLGSKTDLKVAEKAGEVLTKLQVRHEIKVCSAHRQPDELDRTIRESRAKIFIGIAGMSAALPGVIAARTTRPVIGVPVSGGLNLDSLLSVVQMPRGVPVAAVALDGGENAGLLAAEMLALSDDELGARVRAYRDAWRVDGASTTTSATPAPSPK